MNRLIILSLLLVLCILIYGYGVVHPLDGVTRKRALPNTAHSEVQCSAINKIGFATFLINFQFTDKNIHSAKKYYDELINETTQMLQDSGLKYVSLYRSDFNFQHRRPEGYVVSGSIQYRSTDDDELLDKVYLLLKAAQVKVLFANGIKTHVIKEECPKDKDLTEASLSRIIIRDFEDDGYLYINKDGSAELRFGSSTPEHLLIAGKTFDLVSIYEKLKSYPEQSFSRQPGMISYSFWRSGQPHSRSLYIKRDDYIIGLWSTAVEKVGDDNIQKLKQGHISN